MRALVAVLLVLALSGCLGSTADTASPASTNASAGAKGANVTASANESMPDMPGMNMSVRPAVEVTFKLAGIYPANPTFDPSKVEVKAGTLLKVTFQNTDLNPLGAHNWKLDKVEGAATKVVGQGGSETITFTAPAPGEYAYYCAVPGHRGFGMEGKLIVK